jgi:hypothetical protein
MDRNGKKPKAARADGAHPERSDTKSQSRDTLERMNADAAIQRERSAGGAAAAVPKGRRGGHRP